MYAFAQANMSSSAPRTSLDLVCIHCTVLPLLQRLTVGLCPPLYCRYCIVLLCFCALFYAVLQSHSCATLLQAWGYGVMCCSAALLLLQCNVLLSAQHVLHNCMRNHERAPHRVQSRRAPPVGHHRLISRMRSRVLPKYHPPLQR
jgi:hypothetical protein